MAHITKMDRLSLDEVSKPTDYSQILADLTTAESHDRVSFREREGEILALYDQLEELRLEAALTEGLRGEHSGEPRAGLYALCL